MRTGIEAFDAVAVGPGDDCAVLHTGSVMLIIGVDQLVEGRHFEPGTPVDQIARKAVARSVSDIAAMCATPTWGLATAALPDGYTDGGTLSDALHAAANAFRFPIVGGDIAFSDGPLVLSVTVAGTCAEPALRSHAEPGDGVYVTGKLGGSFPSGRHLSFEPRVAEGLALREHLADQLGAVMDISDGLGRDAGRIADASGVRIELDASAFPLHDGCTWQNALADGEDYELLFTARVPPPESVAGTPITRIGTAAEGSGACVRTPAGPIEPCHESGWDHGTPA